MMEHEFRDGSECHVKPLTFVVARKAGTHGDAMNPSAIDDVLCVKKLWKNTAKWNTKAPWGGLRELWKGQRVNRNKSLNSVCQEEGFLNALRP